MRGAYKAEIKVDIRRFRSAKPGQKEKRPEFQIELP
jgi:hypothetical protein